MSRMAHLHMANNLCSTKSLRYLSTGINSPDKWLSTYRDILQGSLSRAWSKVVPLISTCDDEAIDWLVQSAIRAWTTLGR